MSEESKSELKNEPENEPEKEAQDSNVLHRNKKIFIIIAVAVVAIITANLAKYQFIDDTDRLYVDDDESFLNFVEATYNDEDLVEWEPQPPPISKPDEPGNLGAAVIVPPEQEEIAEERFKEHEFNVVANEMMSVNRTLADSRFPECLDIEYPTKLPTTSIIIVFHNEAWSTLIRTIWSVITQSPKGLVKEIILVDDFSDKDYLVEKLHAYVKTLPAKIVLARTLSRSGLIKARLKGTKYATGKVLLFLDAHCECNQGWLEPLLTPITKSRSTVVVPIIDVIKFQNMELVTAVTNSRGTFDMSMTFGWEPIPDEEMDALSDRTSYTKTPAMAGGLFAIDKEYFFKIGSYDEDMIIWGGENLEISLRIWMTGGTLLTIPCSRVGHIFRDNTPYTMPGGGSHIVHRNAARVADVWLDEYKKYFYSVVPEALKKRTNTTKRQQLRKQLKSKSFRWYLNNIYPESPFNDNFERIVEIESIGEKGMCVDAMNRKKNGEAISVFNCHHSGGNQAFMLTEKNEIRAKKFCIDATAAGEPVTIFRCHGEGGNQKWVYHEEQNEIRHSVGNDCLTKRPNEDLTIGKCDGSPAQKWILNTLGDDYLSSIYG